MVMRFALLGNHPDGLDFIRALVETGRHELAAYCGPVAGAEALRERGLPIHPSGDLEEVLADPAVEAVVVASRIADRAEHLRRALQSERHVLCAHPADQTPDTAYEAAMIQADTRQVLLPLLPWTLHPGVARLRQLLHDRDTPLGKIGLIEIEIASTGRVLSDTDPVRQRPAVPGWDIFRALGGEIAEVSAFATGEELTAAQPLLLTGRFEGGVLFRGSYLPDRAESVWHIRMSGEDAKVELVFTRGWPGPARFCRHEAAGARQDESWETWDPWPTLVRVFEAAAGLWPTTGPLPPRPAPANTPPDAITAEKPGPHILAGELPPLSWQDEVRCLELDAAVRRSVHYRRVSVMEYQEATEEAGFKGTMTLVGCGLLWSILFLLILSVWAPRAGWLIGPVLVIFLFLQLFRWIIPRSQGAGGGGHASGSKTPDTGRVRQDSP
jgi:predicted dehydrogenase